MIIEIDLNFIHFEKLSKQVFRAVRSREMEVWAWLFSSKIVVWSLQFEIMPGQMLDLKQLVGQWVLSLKCLLIMAHERR